jgi:hypothetical protein
MNKFRVRFMMCKEDVELTVRLYDWESVLESNVGYGRRSISFPAWVLGLNAVGEIQINLIRLIKSKSNCDVLVSLISWVIFVRVIVVSTNELFLVLVAVLME